MTTCTIVPPVVVPVPAVVKVVPPEPLLLELVVEVTLFLPQEARTIASKKTVHKNTT
jgi:hypothetical protein